MFATENLITHWKTLSQYEKLVKESEIFRKTWSYFDDFMAEDERAIKLTELNSLLTIKKPVLNNPFSNDITIDSSFVNSLKNEYGINNTSEDGWKFDDFTRVYDKDELLEHVFKLLSVNVSDVQSVPVTIQIVNRVFKDDDGFWQFYFTSTQREWNDVFVLIQFNNCLVTLIPGNDMKIDSMVVHKVSPINFSFVKEIIEWDDSE